MPKKPSRPSAPAADAAQVPDATPERGTVAVERATTADAGWADAGTTKTAPATATAASAAEENAPAAGTRAGAATTTTAAADCRTTGTRRRKPTSAPTAASAEPATGEPAADPTTAELSPPAETGAATGHDSENAADPARTPEHAAPGGGPEAIGDDATGDGATGDGGPAVGGAGVGDPAAGESVQDRVWAALRAHPGTTPAKLATEARVSRATVTGLLTAWAAEGSVTSTPGPTARAARRWTAAPALPVPPPSGTNTDAGTRDEPGSAPAADAGTDRQPDTAPRPDTGSTRTPNDAAARQALESAPPAGAASPAPRAPSTNRSGSRRLGAGALRRIVEEFLTEHPGDHGPVEIGKAINRSSGAVANALERLVAGGWAERTSDKPKRYRFADPAPTEATTGASADPAPEAAETGAAPAGAARRPGKKARAGSGG